MKQKENTYTKQSNLQAFNNIAFTKAREIPEKHINRQAREKRESNIIPPYAYIIE